MSSITESHHPRGPATSMEKDTKPPVGGDQVETGSSSYIDKNTKMSVQTEELQYTDQEAKQVKRKIDLIVLPLLCGCYIFSVSLPTEVIYKTSMIDNLQWPSVLGQDTLELLIDLRAQESLEIGGLRLLLAWQVSFPSRVVTSKMKYLTKQYLLHRLYDRCYDVGEACSAVSHACRQIDCDGCPYMVFDCAPHTYDTFFQPSSPPSQPIIEDLY